MDTDTIDQKVNREKLLGDINEVLRDADTLVRETAGDLGEKAKEVRGKLAFKLEGARHRFRELESAAREKVIAGAKQADKTIRLHPYESIAIALGVGLLVGLAVRRK